MGTEYIRDNIGRLIGSTQTEGNKTTIRDFKSNKIVATYDSKSNSTLDWRRNQKVKGNQGLRFLGS